MNTDGQGVGITMLLRRGDVSYRRMTKPMVAPVGEELKLEETLDKASKYRISDKGIQFLQAYIQFEDFAQSYGLRL